MSSQIDDAASIISIRITMMVVVVVLRSTTNFIFVVVVGIVVPSPTARTRYAAPGNALFFKLPLLLLLVSLFQLVTTPCARQRSYC